ncbi:MAG TPA: hypothetical protein VFO44_10620 [Steroidobacteraceae bacterium]|nr:hypothetical protein [Steroidobacteraceae bacterium]
MKSSLVSRAVTAASLLLTAVPLFAQELPFSAPATDMTQQRAELLHRVAHALDDLQSNARLAADGKHIGDLWLFPTADANTVFVRYTLSSNGLRTGSAQHLAVLSLSEARIVEFRELTGGPSELQAEYAREIARARVARVGR